MRRAFTITVFLLFAYLAAELVYLAFIGSYSASFRFLIDLFTGLLSGLSNLNSPEYFDWRWFLLLFINVLIALFITFFYTRRFNAKKQERLVDELDQNVSILNEEAFNMMEYEVKQTEQHEPIQFDPFDDHEPLVEPKVTEKDLLEPKNNGAMLQDHTETSIEALSSKKPQVKSLRKKEIAETVSRTTDLSNYKSMQVINALIEVVEEELNENEVITLPGLGKFNKKHRDSRSGISPVTGQVIKIDEHNTVTYKPDEELRLYINRLVIPVEEEPTVELNAMLSTTREQEITTEEEPTAAINAMLSTSKKEAKKEKIKSLRKKEIADTVSARTDLSHYKAMQAINVLIEIVEEELNENQVITIPELGKFNKKHRDSRPGVNPTTGEVIEIQEHNTVTYKPSDWLKEYLNKEEQHSTQHKTVKNVNHIGKTELYDTIAKETGLSHDKSRLLLNGLLEVIEEELLNSNEFILPDIGKFERKHRDAKKGINPNTKEVIYIPSHYVVTFKASKPLKDKVN